jgi:hypothetical protein
LIRFGLRDLIGADHLFHSVDEALQALTAGGGAQR